MIYIKTIQKYGLGVEPKGAELEEEVLTSFKKLLPH